MSPECRWYEALVFAHCGSSRRCGGRLCFNYPHHHAGGPGYWCQFSTTSLVRGLAVLYDGDHDFYIMLALQDADHHRMVHAGGGFGGGQCRPHLSNSIGGLRRCWGFDGSHRVGETSGARH